RLNSHLSAHLVFQRLSGAYMRTRTWAKPTIVLITFAHHAVCGHGRSVRGLAPVLWTRAHRAAHICNLEFSQDLQEQNSGRGKTARTPLSVLLRPATQMHCHLRLSRL